jgi:hypothetical protein
MAARVQTPLEQGLGTVNTGLIQHNNMPDSTPLPRLRAAGEQWAGHHAALAARLGRPDAVRLTEEQETLALGIVARLVVRIGTGLPLIAQPGAVWALWESTGVPSAALLAPSVLARVEEYRWRRMVRAPASQPLLALFPGSDSDSDSSGAPPPVPAVPVTDSAEHAAMDVAYLALRIADAQRSDPFGMPEVLPQELPEAARRALLLDIAAQDLALADNPSARAGEVAAAVEAALQTPHISGIDTATRDFAASVDATGEAPELLAAAVLRHDWLAVTAYLAAKYDTPFSVTAASLVGQDEAATSAACAAVGMPRRAIGALLDALAEVPARPHFSAASVAETQHDASMAEEMSLRAAALRPRGDGGRA